VQSVDEIHEIKFYVPAMPQGGQHHVISRGQKPKFYRKQDLKDIGEGKTVWVDTFEKQLTGLYFSLGSPVPYAFRMPDGLIRSLDAGCIKMLLNRNPPDIELEFDAAGFIETARPSHRLLELYLPLKEKLMHRVKTASSSD